MKPWFWVLVKPGRLTGTGARGNSASGYLSTRDTNKTGYLGST